MAKGTVFNPERAIMRDERSGLRIIRLTHGPTISMNLYFEMRSFTRNARYVVVLSQRYAGREAPWDLLRARTDGLELVQLTECGDLSGIAVSPARGSVFYQSGGEVREVAIETLDERAVAKAPASHPSYPHSLASVDAAGAQYFASCRQSPEKAFLFRADTDTGAVRVLHESQGQNHIHVDPAGNQVRFGDQKGAVWGPCIVNADGSDIRPHPGESRWLAHCTWFADTGRMQGTLLPPGQAIVTYGAGDEAPCPLTTGRYYWHSSATPDGQWIVADTNWPREGLFLLHVPSGTVSYLCNPGASCSHPQWTHPHPALSEGAEFIVFNSDVTGVGQVYLVELTKAFLEQAASGHLCQPERFV